MFESKFWSVVERMCTYVRTCVWSISEFHRLKIQYFNYDWLKCICWLFKLLIFGLKLFYRFCFLLTYIKCFFFSQHLGSFGPMKYKVGIMVFKSIFFIVCVIVFSHRSVVLSRSRKCKLSLNFDNRRKFLTDSSRSFYHPTQSVR